MVSWGLQVNDYGNAILDADGNFIKVKDAGVTENMWRQMVAYAEANGWKKGNYKSLNLPFEPKLMGQPRAIRERMVQRVEDFVYNLLVDVFNAQDSAPLGIKAILEKGSYDMGPKVGCLEDPAQWSGEKIARRAASLGGDKGPEGDFDD
jgi:hypothetical protein